MIYLYIFFCLKINFYFDTGYFGFIEASAREPQSYADLQLPNMDDCPAYHLNFFYHMLGIYIGRLDVISDGTVIWSQAGGRFYMEL